MTTINYTREGVTKSFTHEQTAKDRIVITTPDATYHFTQDEYYAFLNGLKFLGCEIRVAGEERAI